jgi:hypothetical protein
MKYISPALQVEQARQVHSSQRQHFVQPVNSPLYVVTAITNPHRYYARYKLYQAFEKMVADAGAILITVECALRDRHFEVTSATNPYHLQLRSPDILWLKENLINLGIRHLLQLHPDAEYIAWIDADVKFTRPDWATETIHQLQISKVVQMWSNAIDLAPDSDNNESAYQAPISQVQSLFQSYSRDRTIMDKPESLNDAYGLSTKRGKLYQRHPGYAWAARRSALADLGGLGDIGILGASDRHMAYALLGHVELSLETHMAPSYAEYWLEWQANAEAHIQRKVGVVPGTLLHYWHGPKANRKYFERWRILVDNQFDYRKDLKRDPQGVWALTTKNWKLRDDLIAYFGQRAEDDSRL